MNLLVTASASPFALRLLPRLLAEPDFTQVLGADAYESDFSHDRFVQVLHDLRSPQIEHMLQDVEALVHLASAASDDDAASGTVLQTAQNLYTRAAAAGVRHVVHLSSALIYDISPSAAGQSVDEGHARGAPAGCVAAEALLAVEHWLDGFEREHRDVRLVRLRPHWALGPHCSSILARLLNQRLSLRRPEPALQQCVHEDDVVEAIVQALQCEARGAFNLACADSMLLADLQRQAHWLRLPVAPRLLARRLGTTTGCIEALNRTLLLDSTRARKKLGWRPRYDNVREILRHR